MWFSEWKEKENLKDDVNADTVEFNFKNTFIFDKTMTLPLTGDEIIIMPHFAIIVCYTINIILRKFSIYFLIQVLVIVILLNYSIVFYYSLLYL